MEKIKEKENDVLSMILKSDELFKSFTSTQDELSAFLSLEKERRDNVSLSLEIAIRAEASRQKSALNKIAEMLRNLNGTVCSCSIILEELKKEEQLRNMIAQEILERYSEEKSRCKKASASFNVLFDIRLKKFESEIDLRNRACLENLENPKINKPKISR